MKNLMLIVLIPTVLTLLGCGSSTTGVMGETPNAPINNEIPDIQERPELGPTPIPVLEGELEPESEIIEVSADAPAADEVAPSPTEEEGSSEIVQDETPATESDDQEMIAVVVTGRCNGKSTVKVSWYDRRSAGSKSRQRAECVNDEYQVEIRERKANLKHLDVVVE